MASKSTEKLVLHVGCGPATLKHMPPPFRNGEWKEVRFDIDPACNPDIVGTITDMDRVETGSVDAIYSSHNVEHVFPHEVISVFREFHRVLKKNGFALITCPDLQALGDYIAQGKLHEPIYQSGLGPVAPIDILYGHRSSIEEGKHYMAHRGGFTSDSLTTSLRDAGFAMVGTGKRTEGSINLWAYASKVRLAPDDLRTKMSTHFLRR